MTARLPVVDSDTGTWGDLINEFLSVGHNPDGTLKTIFPLYRSASYYFCNSPAEASTSNTLTNSQLRLSPFVVPKSLSITKIGAEFTVAGDAASVFRIGIYADDNNGVPTGAAALDAGSISTGTGNAGTVATGGTPGVYEITVSKTLTAGLYWVGGAVQGAATTQPTMRVVSPGTMNAPVPLTAIPGTNSAVIGWQMAASGALPTWSGTSSSTAAVRIFFKTA